MCSGAARNAPRRTGARRRPTSLLPAARRLRHRPERVVDREAVRTLDRRKILECFRERASNARYSLPFFLHFNPDFLIETLPQCIDAQHPNRFPVPINAHDFLQERLREIKLI